MEVLVDTDRIYRLKAMLNSMAIGDFSRRIPIEGKADYFEIVEQSANRLSVEISEKLKHLVEINPVGSRYFLLQIGFSLDKDLNIAAVDTATSKHLDYKLKNIIGRPFREVLNKKSRKKWDKVAKQLDQVIKGPKLIKLRFPTKQLESSGHFQITADQNSNNLWYRLSSTEAVLHEELLFYQEEDKKTKAFKSYKDGNKVLSLWGTREDLRRMDDVLTYLCDHAEGPLPKNSVLVKEFGVNESKLRKDFKLNMGETHRQIHAKIRIYWAKTLIDSMVPPKDAASQLHFGNYSAFCTTFKNWFGYSPGTARKRAQSLRM